MINAERVTKDRFEEVLRRVRFSLNLVSRPGVEDTESRLFYTDLLAIIEDYSALKAFKDNLMKDGHANLVRVATHRDALKVENEGLRAGKTAECDYRAAWGMCDRLDEVYELKARAEKTEAEFGELRTKLDGAELVREKVEAELIETNKEFWKSRATIDGLKAQLAKQAPLVEAANKWDGRVADWASIKPLIQSVDDYRAALKLREEKGE